MTEPIVVDASAGVELLLATDTGSALAARLPDDATAWVPEIYVVEVAAVLRRAELTRRLEPTRAAVALDRLLSAPVRRTQVAPLLQEAWMLRHNLTVADALYVVLARHLHAPLVTADEKLAAAPDVGVELITA